MWILGTSDKQTPFCPGRSNSLGTRRLGFKLWCGHPFSLGLLYEVGSLIVVLRGALVGRLQACIL